MEGLQKSFPGDSFVMTLTCPTFLICTFSLASSRRAKQILVIVRKAKQWSNKMRARCCPFSISFLIYGRRGTLEICSTPIVCLLSLLRRQQHCIPTPLYVEHLLKSMEQPAVNVILTENPQADKQVNCQQLCFFFCSLFSWHLCLLYRKVIRQIVVLELSIHY